MFSFESEFASSELDHVDFKKANNKLSSVTETHKDQTLYIRNTAAQSIKS